MFNLLTEAAANGGSAGIMLIMYIVIFGVVIYFFTIRPQKKEQTRLSTMINALEVGDYVVTTSGFYGVVISISEDDCIVEFGSNKNCRIPMKKTAIAEVEKQNDAAATETK